jgi:sulfide:quinone oxidoreductase
MVAPRKLTDDVSVGPQITPDQVRELKELGFRSILSNRPDGEEFGQPDFARIEAAAQDQGLEIRHVPAVSGALSEDVAQAFARAVEEMPKPVYAHCRSGTRSTMLWAIGEAGKRSADEIIRIAGEAGTDLSGARGYLEAKAAANG